MKLESTSSARRKNLISKEVADEVEDNDELDELGVNEGNADPGHPKLLPHLTLQGTKVPIKSKVRHCIKTKKSKRTYAWQ